VITTPPVNINHVLEIHQPQLAQNNAQPVQEELITLIKKKGKSSYSVSGVEKI